MQFISTQGRRVGTNLTVYLGDGERVWEVGVGDSCTGRAKIPEEKLLKQFKDNTAVSIFFRNHIGSSMTLIH